jgi:hypothetical protein
MPTFASSIPKPILAQSKQGISTKLKRSTFAATFLLGRLAALEMEGFRLEDI